MYMRRERDEKRGGGIQRRAEIEAEIGLFGIYLHLLASALQRGRSFLHTTDWRKGIF